MNIYYDFHIHSCLSPCGDDDMTPSDIAGMGALNGLTAMALTDHNTCENCPAFFEACKFYGIVPIAGMELTTAEDIHVICLFENLENAMEFSKEVYQRIMPIKNKPEIFGNQNVVDKDGNIISRIDKLLISSTDITIEQVQEFAASFGGVSYPAHIDRESNGIIAVLGSIPAEYGFNVIELNDIENLNEVGNNHPYIRNLRILTSSDAHNLLDIKQAINPLTLDCSDMDLSARHILRFLSKK